MDDRPYITPLDTLSVGEGTRVGAQLNSWPEDIKTLALGFETAEFLHNVATMYSLSEEQQRGVARFLMESILTGGVPTSQTAPELGRVAGLDTATSLQIMKELEAGLLEPLGLSLSGLAAPAAEPELVVDEQGREGLKYSNADDLLADLAELSPTDRDRFLADAKHDNRIIVLQTLSQLKLGADSGGRPLSFRQLVAAEAGDFNAGEWADLARTDPDALAEPAVWGTIATTPLGAMLQGRDPASARDIVLQFGALDSDAQRIAVDPNTSVAIQELVRGGLVPATHATAIGRIIFFVLTGQAAPEDAAALLQKVGLNAVAADAAARTVVALTAPVVAALPEDIAPAAPVTPRNPGLNVPNAPSRTIIDLRKPQP